MHRIQGLGGAVLKTNVDLERAKPIQSTLAAASAVGRNPASRKPDVFAGAIRHEMRSSCASP